MKTLANRGVVARSEHDTAKARFDKATAALTQARSTLSARREALKQAGAQLGYTDLIAPFDAVVLTKNADIGDIITPLGAASTSKAAVVTIADMTTTNDFALLLLSWINDLSFPRSRRLFFERGLVRDLFAVLPDQPEITALSQRYQARFDPRPAGACVRCSPWPRLCERKTAPREFPDSRSFYR